MAAAKRRLHTFAVVGNENSNEKEKKEMQIVKGENTCFEYLLYTLRVVWVRQGREGKCYKVWKATLLNLCKQKIW